MTHFVLFGADGDLRARFVPHNSRVLQVSKRKGGDYQLGYGPAKYCHGAEPESSSFVGTLLV